MSHKIGIFGGTFNPIHVGHLVIAEAAWQEFGLEEIIFIPTADTPKKNMHHGKNCYSGESTFHDFSYRN